MVGQHPAGEAGAVGIGAGGGEPAPEGAVVPLLGLQPCRRLRDGRSDRRALLRHRVQLEDGQRRHVRVGLAAFRTVDAALVSRCLVLSEIQAEVARRALLGEEEGDDAGGLGRAGHGKTTCRKSLADDVREVAGEGGLVLESPADGRHAAHQVGELRDQVGPAERRRFRPGGLGEDQELGCRVGVGLGVRARVVADLGCHRVADLADHASVVTDRLHGEGSVDAHAVVEEPRAGGVVHEPVGELAGEPVGGVAGRCDGRRGGRADQGDSGGRQCGGRGQRSGARGSVEQGVHGFPSRCRAGSDRNRNEPAVDLDSVFLKDVSRRVLRLALPASHATAAGSAYGCGSAPDFDRLPPRADVDVWCAGSPYSRRARRRNPARSVDEDWRSR